MQRVKTGDTVLVIAGKDKGARGEVLRIVKSANRVVVEGVNVVKKHQRPVQAGRRNVQAGHYRIRAPIHLSNVMPICPSCEEPTRVGFRVVDDGYKVRVCRKCDADLD